MDSDVKEAAVKSARDTHDTANTGGATSARMPLAARILLVAVAILLVAVAAMAGVNLSATAKFNQATTSLNANIKAAQDGTSDVNTVKAQQQQTDAQFEEAGRLRALLLPQVKDAIDANASVSSQLTKIMLKRAEAQQNGTEESQDQAAQAEQSQSSSSKAAKNGGLTDEQKRQVEELMKANQQSTDTQSNTTKSEQQATKNKGTGTSKPW